MRAPLFCTDYNIYNWFQFSGLLPVFVHDIDKPLKLTPFCTNYSAAATKGKGKINQSRALLN